MSGKGDAEAAARAWAEFLRTDAWEDLRIWLEAQRRRANRLAAMLGQSPEDRAVLCGVGWMIDRILSRPEDAIERIARRLHPPLANGALYSSRRDRTTPSPFRGAQNLEEGDS